MAPGIGLGLPSVWHYVLFIMSVADQGSFSLFDKTYCKLLNNYNKLKVLKLKSLLICWEVCMLHSENCQKATP